MKRGVHSRLFCGRGHSLQGDNVYVSVRGSRSCKTCSLASSTRRYQGFTPEEKRASIFNAVVRNTKRGLVNYIQTYESQQGRCALCDKIDTEYRLCSDHDHSHCSGRHGCEQCARGFLCRSCNQGIGFLLDSPELLRKAAKYIEYWRKEHAGRAVGDLVPKTPTR